MAENKKSTVFRQKNIDAIESPEVLDQYLKATSPSIWLILGAVIALLVGGIVWSIFGTIDSTVQVAVVCENGEKYCMIPEIALPAVIENRVVKIDGKDYELAPKSIAPLSVADDWDVYVLIAGKLSAGQIVYQIPVASDMEEGVFAGTVVTETISPISFILN